jgi:AcrR family transcriptional regulator
MAMTKPAMDRRIVRTRATLQHALNSLILKKGYEAITIKDICDAANVGRSTFYAHYTGKDDLKRSGFEPLRRLLVARQKQGLGDAGRHQGPKFWLQPDHVRACP